jgi:hypothetical protein
MNPIDALDWFGEFAYTHLFEDNSDLNLCNDGWQLQFDNIAGLIARIFNGDPGNIRRTLGALCQLGEVTSPLTQTALNTISIDAFQQIAAYYGISDTVVRVIGFINTGLIDCSMSENIDPVGMARIFAILQQRSLFEVACQHNHLCIVIKLLKNGYITTPMSIQLASENGHTNVVGTLLRWDMRTHRNRNIDTRRIINNRALQLASTNGHIDTVQLLLAYHHITDPGADDSAALRLASTHGHIDIVRILLEDTRTIVTISGALQSARTNGHINIIKLLEEHNRLFQHQ